MKMIKNTMYENCSYLMGDLSITPLLVRRLYFALVLQHNSILVEIVLFHAHSRQSQRLISKKKTEVAPPLPCIQIT